MEERFFAMGLEEPGMDDKVDLSFANQKRCVGILLRDIGDWLDHTKTELCEPLTIDVIKDFGGSGVPYLRCRCALERAVPADSSPSAAPSPH